MERRWCSLMCEASYLGDEDGPREARRGWWKERTILRLPFHYVNPRAHGSTDSRLVITETVTMRK